MVSPIDDLRKLYGDNYKVHGASPKGVFWNDRTTQYLRFDKLWQGLPKITSSRPTLLDVGCGTCDLYAYFCKNGIDVDYTGLEIVDGMITQAQTTFPTIKVINQDIVEKDIPQRFDYCVLSGTLNLRPTTYGNWQQFCNKLLLSMFRHSNVAISFNFLTTYNTLPSKALHYCDPREMFDFCQSNMSRFVKLDHDYPLYEATMTVVKQEYMHTSYTHREFEKYFPKL